VARPMPLEPPVIKATFPSRRYLSMYTISLLWYFPGAFQILSIF
jgi:hypothetical protein